MRIAHGNLCRNVVDQNLTRHSEETKRERILSAVKQQQSAEEAMAEQKNQQEAYLEAMNQQMKISGEQMKGEKEKLKILLTCLEISRRLAGGDKVPQADHQYLMKHDSALYARSILMRFPKHNPHEYKQLSEDSGCRDELQIGSLDGNASYQGLKDVLVQCGGAVLDVTV
ncbi:MULTISPECIES: hypothetical protein [Desulfitobacterium]|uniref:Uncharacterized protein n=1 Tax=Desulfitobacterium dehalogenans (strain ATCC 51507 / DSM 9161 / JW/IU-DC1) TaxID=756499 RepID=I4ACD8_DESDJ|nr:MULTISPECIES: hypothetical protein [Desulfitobacterium]AFM01623.1 hypothetical protein Desde_3335 [Desulfitobacterium dehalogenans ATCC 51507]